MKIFNVLIIIFTLISFITCDTLVRNTVSVTVDRHPTLTIINQTGYPVNVTAPVSLNINTGARTQFQPTETSRSINVTYRIEQIEFTEQITMNNADATVTLTRRPPTVTVRNQTGRQVIINSPVSRSINNGESINFLPPLLNGNLNITYSSGLMRLTESVTMRNQDVTVNLTVGAPTLTIVNNTVAGNNVNIIQFRTPGSVAWTGGNIIIDENNELRLSRGGTAQTGVTTQVLTNGDRLSLWLGNLELSGNSFDVRLQTPSDVIFQRDNVRITNDIILTFTSADRR